MKKEDELRMETRNGNKINSDRVEWKYDEWREVRYSTCHSTMLMQRPSSRNKVHGNM